MIQNSSDIMFILIFRYTQEEFEISNGIEIVSINTLVNKNLSSTKRDLINHLITHWEEAKIKQDGKTSIKYERINHLNFKYQINIRNPSKISKKVIIRIWLGIAQDQTDIR